MKKKICYDRENMFSSLIKLLKVMKLTILLFLVSVSGVLAKKSYSKTQMLNLNMRKATVKEVFNSIEKQSEFCSVYDENLIDEKREGESQVWQQKSSISGIVTDEFGQTLPGVTVLIKGTTTGTVTDVDGKYSISNISEDAILVFSFVGMLTQEIVIGGRTILDVQMRMDAVGLEEVVAVGYGTQRKSDITGSVASISSKELHELPVARVDQALQGRIAGVEIQNNDAAPNGKTTIRIRGANSIQGGNNPLIVVDGFVGNSLNKINPNDIKSIEVLKDASATAIYGSRGANGVVLITTKKGDSEKATVTYSSFLKYHTIAKKLDLMNAAQYAETVNANRVELGGSAIFSDSEIAGFRTNGGTDWQDEIYRSGFTQNHHIGIGGSNEKFSYYLSGEYVDQTGIVRNSSYTRYAIRPNLCFKFNDKLKARLNAYLAKEIDHPTEQNDLVGSAIYSAQLFAPVIPVYDVEGNYSLPQGGYGTTLNYNPLGQAVEPVVENFDNTVSISADIEYQIADGLTLNLMGGYRSFDFEHNSFNNAKVAQNYGEENATILNGRFMTLQNTNMLTYKKDVNKHSITLTGVFEQQFEEINESSIGAKGSLLNTGTFDNIGVGAIFFPPRSSRKKRTLLSYMGRINYGFDGRYLLTLTARSDGASVFGANNKRAFFPSAALGWNVTEEDFMSSSEVLTNLKVRTSWGVVGNQAIAPYTSLPMLNAGGTATFPINGLTNTTGVNISTRAANPDLKWETTTQLNVGFDAYFFDGKIQTIFDYYNKQTEDLLQLANLPNTSGSTQILRNIGKVENKGFELYIGATPLEGEFLWKTGAILNINRNNVVDLGDVTEMSIGNAPVAGFENSIWLEEGQPLGLFRGYEYVGVWKSSEATEASQYSSGGVAFFPGAPKFVDQNGDKVIDAKDIVNIGNAQPDFTFGWNNTLNYKGFELSVFIQGVQGKENFNVARQRVETTSNDADATSTKILNRWSTDNENTNVPSFTGYSSFPLRNSSRWIEDASYFRLKTINLGYNLPSYVVSSLGIGSARIYFNGTNLFTLTDYSGYDPEASTSVDTFGGIDLASFPSQKIYTFGLNITF
uniref:SusC/RagA family TonB-linked outer membrane protein n=1 Tax=uncultured Draconibacterium sp. TaxID=1573823 RepID=UPI003216DEE6